MSKLFLVAKRQYVQTIRKPSFWIATLFFPAFIILVSFISGYTATQAEKKIEEELKEVQAIQIIDEARILNPSLVVSPYQAVDDLAGAIDAVKREEIDALFVYPSDFTQNHLIDIYTQDEGIIAREKYNEVARQLVKQSILLEVEDPTKIALFNADLEINGTFYQDGEVVSDQIENYIIPLASMVLYFTMVFMGTNFLLSSVSEEKENRMIEIVLTAMQSKDLIWGKIAGLVGIILTQLVVLVTLAGLGLSATIENLPFEIDWTAIPIEPMQILVSVFYILAGFLIIATIMVGVGSAMPTYREAQQFSSIFIIASILPVYFATVIIAEPNGLVAMITSYFPLTSPLILLARNALGAVPLWESLISIPILTIYVLTGFYLAFKLFELGSLQYNEKLSIKTIGTIFSKKSKAA